MTFPTGTRVRVRDNWPEAFGLSHIRTPHYVRGETGVVMQYLGDFANPEDLAFSRPAARLPLYHVRFELPEIWREPRRGDEVVVELFGHWLEEA